MKRTSLFQSSIFLIAILLFYSCSKSGSNPMPQNNAPTIASLSINTGPFNTSVTIIGTGFSSSKADDKVFFNGKQATVTSATSTQIIVAVPLGAGTGKVTVAVNGGAIIDGPVFNYQYTPTITTFAGGAKGGIQDGKGSAASFLGVWGIVMDAAGNLYVSDYTTTLIRKITPDGTVSTFAGNTLNENISGQGGISVDGKGSTASFAAPAGMAIDPSGNLFVADKNLIRKITPDGTVTTIINSKLSYSSNFLGIALDSIGNIYASDIGNDVILKVGQLGTSNILVAGKQGSTYLFESPYGLHFGAANNLYMVGSNKVNRISSNGAINLIAGTGYPGLMNGIASKATFFNPTGITTDSFGNIYVSDYGNKAIRQITPDGTVSILVVTNDLYSASGPYDMVFDHSGNIFLADGEFVLKITFQ